MSKYFNVMEDIKIGQKLHVPCVSYPVTPNNELTIEKLSKEGKVEITSYEAIFQSGRKINEPVKAKEKVSMKAASDKIKEKAVAFEKDN
jgi:ribosomal protein L21